MTMTLEQVRDALREYQSTGHVFNVKSLADAIDFHLSQPQPVAQGEAVHPVDAVWQALDKVSCPGVYMKIAAEAVAAAIATPTIPTGHRVVPVVPTEAALSRGLHAWEDELNSWTAIGGTLDRKEVVEAIYKAMTASPSAGGV